MYGYSPIMPFPFGNRLLFSAGLSCNAMATLDVVLLTPYLIAYDLTRR